MGRAINYTELKRRFELDGPGKTVKHLREAIREKALRPDDFSIRELAEGLVEDGREWVRSMDPGKSGGFVTLAEASAVNTTAFSNITGQLVFSKIMEAYENPAYIFSSIVPTQKTNILGGEKIPGVTGMGDEGEIVGEAEQYPTLGFGEDWIMTPKLVKRGGIVPITREAIFADRTSLVLSRAAGIGDVLGVGKEIRIIDSLVDENTTTHRHNWRGTSYATFQSSSPWVNLKTSNGLADWTDIDAAQQLFEGMTDPFTGLPITLAGFDMVVTPQLRATANRVLNATEVRETTNTSTVTVGPVPVQTNYTVHSSALLAQRMTTDTSWIIGDIRKALVYMEAWPITVTQAPANSEKEFNNDIVVQYRASEMGAAFVQQPRFLVKSTVA